MSYKKQIFNYKQMANKVIIITVSLYIILAISMYLKFLNMGFSGNDAAGNGMSKGLTFFYGLGILFLIAVILTIVNTYFFKDITSIWIKILFFIPIILPTFVIIWLWVFG